MKRLYKLIWFYSEWFLPPEKRRPFTFIIRDIYYKSPLLVVVFGAIGFYLLGRYTTQISASSLLSHIVVGLICIVIGHVLWGKKYIPDQQEDQTYLGEDQWQSLKRF